MNKWPKIFLVLSVITLGFGLTSVGSSIAYGVLKPAGVILFILFYITHLFEREVAQYDEETRSKAAQTKSNSKSRATSKSASDSSGEAREGSGLAAAHAK